MSTARDTLEKCCQRLQGLSEGIDRIRSIGKSSEALVAPPPTPSSPSVSFVSMPPKRAPARCHECHGPLAGYHQGYQHGLDLCQLEHYDLCGGGVTEKDRGGNSWRPCPSEYEPPLATEEDLVDNEMENSDSDSSQKDDPDYNPGEFSPPPQLQRREKVKEVIGEETFESLDGQTTGNTESVKTNHTAPPIKPSPAENSVKSAEDLILEQELAELAAAEAKEKKLKEAVEVRRRKEQALERIEQLSLMAKDDGKRKKASIHNNIELLRSANRPQVESRREQSGYQGPTMPEMRLNEETRDSVDSMMPHVYDIPAFSNANQQRHGQPKLKQQSIRPSTVPRPATVVQDFQQSDHRVTRPSKEDTLYKWVLRKDRQGAEYQELVEVVPEKPAAKSRIIVDTEPGWFYDEHSGRMYRSQVPSYGLAQHDTAQTNNVQSQRYIDSRLESQTPARQHQQWTGMTRTPARVLTDADDRFPGIVPLTTQPSEDREGKTPLSIASHALNMPMECARSATSKNMNFAVFMYGAIHELHSSRIGITPAFPRGVLEAKLQHLMNVIHVTSLNASPTDFKPVAWSVGRTYHNLVQAKVDSGREGWTDFDALHRGSPHAAEMISAEREHREALTKKPEKTDPKKKTKDGDRATCPTWNDFEEEGKCKWESENPGEKCSRSHHCSFCKKKNPSFRTFHQARFCKRKPESDK